MGTALRRLRKLRGRCHPPGHSMRYALYSMKIKLLLSRRKRPSASNQITSSKAKSTNLLEMGLMPPDPFRKTISTKSAIQLWPEISEMNSKIKIDCQPWQKLQLARTHRSRRSTRAILSTWVPTMISRIRPLQPSRTKIVSSLELHSLPRIRPHQTLLNKIRVPNCSKTRHQKQQRMRRRTTVTIRISLSALNRI